MFGVGVVQFEAAHAGFQVVENAGLQEVYVTQPFHVFSLQPLYLSQGSQTGVAIVSFDDTWDVKYSILC